MKSCSPAPMLCMIDSFYPLFAQHGATITTPNVEKSLSVKELKTLVPQHAGWIIGGAPATRQVFETGKAVRLRAAVKWGIGVDNVGFAACECLGIPITNTPSSHTPLEASWPKSLWATT